MPTRVTVVALTSVIVQIIPVGTYRLISLSLILGGLVCAYFGLKLVRST